MEPLPACKNESRRGSALVLGTLLIIVLASAATILTEVTISRFKEQGRRQDEVILMTTAESAFNEAYDYFQTDPTRLPTVVDEPVTYDADSDASGLFDASVPHNNLRVNVTVTLLEDLDTSQWGDESYRFVAMATAGDLTDRAEFYRRRCVEAIIRPSPQSILKQCMYAILGYTIMGSASTDSYNASTAPYVLPSGASYLNSSGDVASGGSVVDATGDVHGAVLSNVTLNLPTLDYSPPATAIAVASPAGTGKITSDYTFTSPGTYSTNELSNTTLRVEGGGTVKLYVNGPVNIGGTSVQFDSFDSKLIVYQNDYIGGSTSLNGNDRVGEIVPVAGGSPTEPARPSQFLWITNYSGEVTLNGNAALRCVVFAPNATFKMNGTFDFYGAMIVKAFNNSKVNGNFMFHYDESLANMSIDSVPHLQVAGWRSYNLSANQ